MVKTNRKTAAPVEVPKAPKSAKGTTLPAPKPPSRAEMEAAEAELDKKIEMEEVVEEAQPAKSGRGRGGPRDLGPRGQFVVEVTLEDGTVKYTGFGKDYLTPTYDKAQVYKTMGGAQRWIEKQGYASARIIDKATGETAVAANPAPTASSEGGEAEAEAQVDGEGDAEVEVGDEEAGDEGGDEDDE